MKKVITILLLAAIVASASGCGVSKSESQTQSNAESSASEIVAESSSEKEGSGIVAITSAEIGTNYNDEPALIVTYTFTNTTDKASSFTLAVTDKAYQDGVECKDTFSADMDDGDQMTDVQPGVSIDVKVLYALRDTTTPVDITVTDLFGTKTYLEQQVAI